MQRPFHSFNKCFWFPHDIEGPGRPSFKASVLTPPCLAVTVSGSEGHQPGRPPEPPDSCAQGRLKIPPATCACCCQGKEHTRLCPGRPQRTGWSGGEGCLVGRVKGLHRTDGAPCPLCRGEERPESLLRGTAEGSGGLKRERKLVTGQAENPAGCSAGGEAGETGSRAVDVQPRSRGFILEAAGICGWVLS